MSNARVPVPDDLIKGIDSAYFIIECHAPKIRPFHLTIEENNRHFLLLQFFEDMRIRRALRNADEQPVNPHAYQTLNVVLLILFVFPRHGENRMVMMFRSSVHHTIYRIREETVFQVGDNYSNCQGPL